MNTSDAVEFVRTSLPFCSFCASLSVIDSKVIELWSCFSLHSAVVRLVQVDVRLNILGIMVKNRLGLRITRSDSRVIASRSVSPLQPPSCMLHQYIYIYIYIGVQQPRMNQDSATPRINGIRATTWTIDHRTTSGNDVNWAAIAVRQLPCCYFWPEGVRECQRQGRGCRNEPY